MVAIPTSQDRKSLQPVLTIQASFLPRLTMWSSVDGSHEYYARRPNLHHHFHVVHLLSIIPTVEEIHDMLSVAVVAS